MAAHVRVVAAQDVALHVVQVDGRVDDPVEGRLRQVGGRPAPDDVQHRDVGEGAVHREVERIGHRHVVRQQGMQLTEVEAHAVVLLDVAPERVRILVDRVRRRVAAEAEQLGEDVADGDGEVHDVGLERPVELGDHQQRAVVRRRHEAREVDEPQLRERGLDLVCRVEHHAQHDGHGQAGLERQDEVERVADRRTGRRAGRAPVHDAGDRRLRIGAVHRVVDQVRGGAAGHDLRQARQEDVDAVVVGDELRERCRILRHGRGRRVEDVGEYRVEQEIEAAREIEHARIERDARGQVELRDDQQRRVVRRRNEPREIHEAGGIQGRLDAGPIGQYLREDPGERPRERPPCRVELQCQIEAVIDLGSHTLPRTPFCGVSIETWLAGVLRARGRRRWSP